jgi:squalene synthase HpnC
MTAIELPATRDDSSFLGVLGGLAVQPAFHCSGRGRSLPNNAYPCSVNRVHASGIEDSSIRPADLRSTSLPSGDAPPDLRSADLPPTVRVALAAETRREAAEVATRALAHSHYENFSVISVLLPRHLKQDFCNVYAFCRVADDLGDEIGDPQRSLALLGEFRRLTREMFDGKTDSVVFTALAATVAKFALPIEPFLDLIDAFEQDQRQFRYSTWDEVLNYCRRSADPVGRLVLYMCGYRDADRQRLSDQTCSALQLTNFWQDVRRDWTDRQRVYLPTDAMRQFGVSEEQIALGRCDEHYRRLLRHLCGKTSAMFDEGEKLLPMLAPVYRRQIALFGRGGRAILSAIERQGYDTLSRRPALSRWQKTRLIASTACSMLAGSLAPGRHP